MFNHNSMLHYLQTSVFSSIVAFLLISLPVSAQAQLDMPIATNLQALGQQAKQNNLPIAILFSYGGLKSTEKLKDEALYPALNSGELDGTVLFTEIQLNKEGKTVDFYGIATENQEYKDLYNLTSLPVVIVVNSEGEVIADPLLSGAYDFYFHYLKQTLNQALSKLGNPKQLE